MKTRKSNYHTERSWKKGLWISLHKNDFTSMTKVIKIKEFSV